MIRATGTGVLSVALGLLLSAAAMGKASATTPACGTITMVAPFPAGSTTDTIARILARQAGLRLQQTIVVDNKPGAEGQIAAADVQRARPDGCRLLFATSGNLSVAPHLRSPQPYDPVRDFTAIADVGRYTYFLYVTPELGAQSYNDFVEVLRAAPGRYNYGTGSNTNLLAFGYLSRSSGLEATRVTYRGEPPAIQDLLAGRIQAMVATTIGVPYVRDGKLRALAVLSSERSPQLPSVPTFAEAGVRSFDIVPWAGIVGPANMDAGMVAALGAAFGAALQDRETREVADTAGFQLTPSSPESFSALVREQFRVYGNVVRELNLPVD